MKKMVLLLALVALTGYSTRLLAQAKRFVLVEHFTQASCSPCAQQNPYLEAVLEQTRGTTHHIAYHTSWPGYDPMYLYNTAGSNARVSYYGINAVPDVIVNGNFFHGGPTGVTQQVIQDAGSDASAIRVKVSETSDGTTRTVHVKVFTLDTLAAATYKIRVAVVEKWIHYTTPPGTNGEKNFPDVFREMLPDNTGASFTPAAIGDSVSDTFTYTLDVAHWDTTQIYTIAFVQNESTKEVINSGSSLAPGWELYSVDPCFANAQPGDTKAFHFKLANLNSTSENFRIKVNTAMPVDWSANFTIGSTTYYDSVDMVIPGHTTLDMLVNVTLGDLAGISNSLVSMQAVGDTNYDAQTSYAMVMSSGVYELIVNNDGSWGGTTNTTSADFQQNYISGLEYAGSTYFDVIRLGALLKAYQFNCLSDVGNYYFNVSWTFPALTNQSVAMYTSEMNKGKNLFISGQDVGWDTWDVADGGHGTAATQAFYTNYLSSAWLADGGTADNKLIANTTDTIFGAVPTTDVVNAYGSNYFYPDEINAVGTGINIFYYNTALTKKAGVRATNGTWKMVYLAPSLEMVKDTNVRKEIIKISHDWFGGPSTGIRNHNGTAGSYLGQSFPNPVSGSATILLNGINSDMTLEVVDLAGRVLQSVRIPAGSASVTVDASSLASGMYLCRLVSGGKILDVNKLQVVH
ncbi:MAG TPA: Omp28-related outer membrane protein [Bacteroidales bacterium]|nr:Omp28-related outer membrane protein [Bacteroidales bacterium]